MAPGVNFILCICVMYQHWIVSTKEVEKYKEENVELLAER